MAKKSELTRLDIAQNIFNIQNRIASEYPNDHNESLLKGMKIILDVIESGETKDFQY